MESKPLIYGIIGFLLGGLLVSIAATTFDKPQSEARMTMNGMVSSLQDKTGNDYDKAFVDEMIDHHQAAIDMAKLSETRATHQEIKDLSKAIIGTQQKEVNDMKTWQNAWGYASSAMKDDM